jgi:hypothetical protein
MAYKDAGDESFFKEFAALANDAVNKWGYKCPFTALIVSADCSVMAFEFVTEEGRYNILYEKARETEPIYLYPMTFFFYCSGKQPFVARISEPGKEAVCQNNTPTRSKTA